MNDDESFEKITITVFPPMQGIGIMEEDPIYEDEDSCGDSSRTHLPPAEIKSDEVVMKLPVNDPMVKIRQLLNVAQGEYGGDVCIQIASYGSHEEIEQAREWMQAALRGSGDNTVLDLHAFTGLIGSSAPILSINNRLSFVGIIPSKAQFLSRIASTMRMLES